MSVVALHLALMLGVGAAPAAAAPLRVGRPAGELRLVFLEGDGTGSLHRGASGDATLEVGKVTGGTCAAHACTRVLVHHSFRIRVDGAIGRFARVEATLDGDQTGRRVRVDGRALTAAPLLVDALSPVGIAVVHTIEIEVPASEPEGLFAQSIAWRVEGVR